MRRPGFTLIEVLIAVVLIDVGLLALVASGSVLVRRTTEYRLQNRAARIAADRLGLLGASPCVAVSGTAASAGGIAESWSAAAPVNGVRELRDSVAFSIGTAAKSVTLRTAQPC